MQTEPMNVDTKDLSCAEALELAIAETRLALEEYADLIDERPVDDMSFLIERSHNVVVAGLDRCKAAADRLSARMQVADLANSVAGQQLRMQAQELARLRGYRDADEMVVRELSVAARGETAFPQDRHAQRYDRRPNLKCATWVIGLVLLGACIEAANGLLGLLL